jgi:hypothetical protein
MSGETITDVRKWMQDTRTLYNKNGIREKRLSFRCLHKSLSLGIGRITALCKFIDVSEEHANYISRFDKQAQEVYACYLLVSYWACSWTIKMKAVRFSETLVSSTRPNITQDNLEFISTELQTALEII